MITWTDEPNDHPDLEGRPVMHTWIKTLLALLTGSILGLGANIVAAVEAGATEPPPAVFIVAHQDDEVITFGSAIQQHKAAGQRVIVVLATDGAKVNTRKIDAWLGRTATDAEVTRHRDFEFGWTMDVAFDVEWAIAPNRGGDGQLTEARAGQVIDWARATYGQDIRVKTHSWLDSHPDHAALGRALQADYAADDDVDARFYIAPHKLAQAQAAGADIPTLHPARWTLPANSLGAYLLWAPDKGPQRYWATPLSGSASTLKTALADPLTYAHKPVQR